MSSIKPFKAVFYNKEKVKDFSLVISPPYDVISEEQQSNLQNLSPYNFTYIDFGKDKPADDKDNNKYSRAAKYLEDWLSKKVMLQDEKPAIYFYKQDYRVLGQISSRLGFIGLMELDSEGDTTIHPHENTHAKAVDDRLKLTKTLNANLSCIFVCYADRQRKVEKIFHKEIVSQKPFIDVTDWDDIRHRIWRLDDAEMIHEINESISGQNLFIADGHHRYQVAQEYRNFRNSRKAAATGSEPYNYVMTYFTNLDSKDLKILPIYRIVKSLKKDIGFLEDYFRIDKVKSKEELQILLARAGKNEHAFGLYTQDGIRLLRLKNKLLVNKVVKEGSSEYKNLDATILKYFVFDKVGVASEDIIYSKDFKEATDMVDNGQAQASFILNPVKIDQLKAIALHGERMPPKTTYFYPKVLSGLTVYKMD